MLLAGEQARSFTYETDIKGSTMLFTDIKVVGPLGQACVISLAGSGLSREEFEEARREGLAVIQKLRLSRRGM